MSARPATLEAIKSRGTPLMDTQIVVDHSEVDPDGFLTASAANDSPALNDFAAQIASLHARAASRDGEAIANTNGSFTKFFREGMYTFLDGCQPPRGCR